MKAILLLPDSRSCLANLIDRPFLQHIVEFLTNQGVNQILMTGPGTRQASAIFDTGSLWNVSIEYREIPSAFGFGDGQACLVGSAVSLPRFPLQEHCSQRTSGQKTSAIVCKPGTSDGTGWAVIGQRDLPKTHAMSDLAQVLAFLETADGCTRLFADSELRCANDADLWLAHKDLQHLNLAGVCHSGLEVKPGIWISRNARVSDSADLEAPVFIGENTRVGAGARIGPFASIGRDCLISPRTTVQNSAIGPGTYVGDNLELDHLVVNQRQLFDVRRNESIDMVDSSLLDSVFDLHVSRIPQKMISSLAQRWLPSRQPADARSSAATKTQIPPERPPSKSSGAAA